MFKLFDGYSSTIDKIERKTEKATDKILKASGSTDKFNKKLEATGASAGIASIGIGKFIGAAALIAGALKGMSMVDAYTNTSARLHMINDGLQTQAELQEKIFAAAERSRGLYSDMASSIAKLQMNAGDAFGSNNETIAFAELMQKSFKVGGASGSEQSAAMHQLTQAMASGRLQGDEFRSISENAPLIFEAISQYTGKSKGELKELASEGALTSDIIKNAMFGMSDEINSKFETMPMTFADIWNKIKNGATEAFAPVTEEISNIINSDGFMRFVDTLIVGFDLASKAAMWLINAVVDGWDTIGPLLAIIGGVYLAFILAQIIATTAAIIAQGIAWLVSMWPLLLIIVIIAIVISAARQLGATWEEIFGFIGGLIGIFGAHFNNIFVYIWNIVASFINFFGNVFTNPIGAVKGMFYDLMTNVLGFVEVMAKGIEDLLNSIPGVEVDITSGITGLKDKLETESSNIKSEEGLKEFVKSKDFMNYSDGYAKGSSMGKSAYNSVSDAISSLTDIMSGDGKGFDTSDYGTNSNPMTVQGTGKNGKVDVDMSEEDLQSLRDIAERDYVAKVASNTLAPNIAIEFSGTISKEVDTDKMYARIGKILKEQIAVAAEGVY